MSLWSHIDEAVGHFRRYSKKELIHKVSNAGFKIISCYYVDVLGFFIWYLLRNKNIEKNNFATSDFNLKFFDKILFPISKTLDFIGFKHLFGKNLLLVAQKL